MQKTISENKISFYLVASALVLFYISDALNKYFQVSYSINDDSIENAFSASIYVRFLYEGLFASIILIRLNETRKKIIVGIIAMIVIFAIGQSAFLIHYNQPDYSVFYHFTLLNKYLYVFIIYGGTYKIIDNSEDYNFLTKIYENIVVINSILIFVGLFLSVNLFKSYYSQDFRYGFDGLIPAINEATLFYFIAISYFYYKHFILKQKNWKMYPVLLASLLLGTKTIYFFLIFLFLYHLAINLSPGKKIIYATVALIISIFLIVPVVTNPDYSFLYEHFKDVYEENGFLSMITSGRIDVIDTKISGNLSYWNILNYFFGGTDQFKYQIEMDFFDLFLFVGIIGSLSMFVLYFKTIFKNPYKNIFFSFFTSCYFLFAFMSGHIFYSATNALNLTLVAIFIRNNYNSQFLQNLVQVE
ncbi:hypothetical protein FO440_11120 [Mucilaginibacter corticis]|uniref:Oligosaccharide repeat unit polymerase n=1 Tax=Mucilaginibacter corticis TaxID=2597670 RepID=A0A556MKA6_9SPHI|nr:hypothetical protein [Mucilaginibacter corticis]TSJ40303.1 hypothetical protein FO440_11120 [Mucilaginibacter corticis]